MREKLRLHILAKTGLIYLISNEEERVETEFEKLCLQLKYGLYTWDSNRGFKEILQDKYNTKVQKLDAMLPGSGDDDPVTQIQLYKGDGIFILKDFQYFLNDSKYSSAQMIIRSLKNLVRDLREQDKNRIIVILSSILMIPDELEHDLTLVDFDLPDQQVLSRCVTEYIAKNKLEKRTNIDQADFDKVIKSLQGLTTIQAERAIAKVFIKHGKLQANFVDDIYFEKKQIISKSGILEYIESTDSLDNIGGLEILKGWLKQREKAFSEKARKYGLPIPKGILLVGVQGVGKSLTAKAVSVAWKLPLVRLDVGRVFGSLVGESEERIRQAIKVAEAISPCILWIDEIDKAFAGISGNQGDSGTSARVFGSLLTWMQEKDKPVFVVATANNVVRIEKKDNKLHYTPILPPELLRKGRFDELFFLDLPTSKEREEIFRIVTQKYGLGCDFDYTLLAERSGGMVNEKNNLGFGGAEIEQIVIEAMYNAFYDNERPVSTEDIMKAMSSGNPLYSSMYDQIEGLRKWGSDNARQASKGEV